MRGVTGDHATAYDERSPSGALRKLISVLAVSYRHLLQQLSFESAGKSCKTDIKPDLFAEIGQA